MPPLTRSGFLRREVYKEFDKALENADAESACLYASELVCTSKRVFIEFVEHLIDVYATWYISPDLKSIETMKNYTVPLFNLDYDLFSAKLRHAMCEPVIVLAAGIPRHPAVTDLMNRINAPSKTTTHSTLADIEAALQMNDVKRTLALTADLLNHIPAGRMAAMQHMHVATQVWNMLLRRIDRHSEPGAFVHYAHDLYHSGAPSSQNVLSITRLKSRLGLLLYSILVCISNPDRLPLSWSISETHKLIGKSQALIGNVFDTIMRQESTKHQENNDGGGEGGDGEGAEMDEIYEDAHPAPAPAQAQPHAQAHKFDYLRMYTTYDYTALCNKQNTHRDPPTKRPPTKVVALDC